MKEYIEKDDIANAKFNTISTPYSQGWNDGINSILYNAPSVLAKDLSVCKPVKLLYRGNSKTIYGYLDETRNIVFTQAMTLEFLKASGFSVVIEEEQLRKGGSEE